jgi:hypothetical protein
MTLPGPPLITSAPVSDSQVRQSPAPVTRFEGEQVEFAFEDVEHLLGLAVQVCPNVESRRDIGLEHRPVPRPLGTHLEGHAHGVDPAACAGR